MTKFYTHLPIQLDASCNGSQHISLLTREIKVFEHLNLTSSTTKDEPADFYTYILYTVSMLIKNKIAEDDFYDIATKNSYIRLGNVNLIRSMVKKDVLQEFVYACNER